VGREADTCALAAAAMEGNLGRASAKATARLSMPGRKTGRLTKGAAAEAAAAAAAEAEAEAEAEAGNWASSRERAAAQQPLALAGARGGASSGHCRHGKASVKRAWRACMCLFSELSQNHSTCFSRFL
jgi:hypothetical protein